MKQLKDFKEDIHKCSKCGLCQKSCPVYQITGNDCTVSRGQFIMLKGLIKGDLKMTSKLNRYLSLCLKCGKCSEFCPSGVDVVDIIASAKQEYFKTHFFEKIVSWIQKYIIFGLVPNIANIFARKIKQKNFTSKVIYFGGCNSKYAGNKALIRLMNKIGIEVITPKFSCCGIPFFTRGDLDNYKKYMDSYIRILKRYDIKDIITTCASCEKTIKDYLKWCDDEEDKKFLSNLKVRNIYEYLHENNVKIKLSKPLKVTYHKPCNQSTFEDIRYVLKNTENLEYVEAEGFDECCGLNGLFRTNEYKILSNIFSAKRNSIISTKANYVLTTCFGCEIALRLYSFGKYKVSNLIEFLEKNIKSIQ